MLKREPGTLSYCSNPFSSKSGNQEAKLASEGLLLSDPENRHSTNGTHAIPVNDEVHQTIDETGSTVGTEEIVVEQSEETLDDGWKKASSHENTRKQLEKIGDGKARD
jgi:hypothetical protein